MDRPYKRHCPSCDWYIVVENTDPVITECPYCDSHVIDSLELAEAEAVKETEKE